MSQKYHISIYDGGWEVNDDVLVNIVVACVLLSGFASAKEKLKVAPVRGTMIDPRNSTKYNTVKIGEVTWMAENLDYPVGTSECSGGNCDKYGRSYVKEDADVACPKGWRLPTRFEWDVLTGYAREELAIVGILEQDSANNRYWASEQSPTTLAHIPWSYAYQFGNGRFQLQYSPRKDDREELIGCPNVGYSSVRCVQNK